MFSLIPVFPPTIYNEYPQIKIVGATFGRPFTCGCPFTSLCKIIIMCIWFGVITYLFIITDFLYIAFIMQILLLTTKP